MGEKDRFDLIFSGNTLPGISREQATRALARLLKKRPEQVEQLFSGRPVPLSRKLSKEKALEYKRTFRRAGLDCRVTRHGADKLPQKTVKTRATEANNRQAREITPIHVEPPPRHFRFPANGRFFSLLLLSFVLPGTIDIRQTQTKTAPWSQRFLAAAATFCHGIYLGYFLAIPVGVLVGVAIVQSGGSVTRELIEELRGFCLLFGLLASVTLVPWRWQGHTYGQRAMGIFLHTPEDDVVGNGPGGIARWFKRLLLQTEPRNVARPPKRPWNQIFLPFLGILLFSVLALPLKSVVETVADWSDSATAEVSHSTSSDSSPIELVNPATHTLHLIAPAINTYILDWGGGSTPLSEELFLKIMRKQMPSGFTAKMKEKLESGNLQLTGDLSQYRIGIYENGQWTILDEQGNIWTAETF